MSNPVKVYFSREITPEKVLEMFKLAGKELTGRVAIKVHSGEPGNQNFLHPDFWKPVIGIPMKGGAMDGLDALLATVQMPSGIPVATVAINGAKNAAVLAAQILAVADDELAEKLDAARVKMAAQIAEKEAKLQAELDQ